MTSEDRTRRLPTLRHHPTDGALAGDPQQIDAAGNGLATDTEAARKRCDIQQPGLIMKKKNG
jgi:hypothetical protein